MPIDRRAAGNPSHVCPVQRLSAHARLDKSPQALERARAEAAAGDESWEQWVVEHQNGQALTVHLELTVEFSGNDRPALTTSVGGFFVETDDHAPKIEQQIAELASGELVALGERVVAHEPRLNVDELALMYVHVELADDLRRELSARRELSHPA